METGGENELRMLARTISADSLAARIRILTTLN
jgi:hypothetical protein